jgi:hypothetical protein
LLWKLLTDWNILSTDRLGRIQLFYKIADSLFPQAGGEVLLPLKKGGREGFLEEPFSNPELDTVGKFPSNGE